VRKVEQTIHVSAAMLGGNSGGPLIDSKGRVIGVSTMVVKGSETLGSCLRIEHAAELLHGGRW
jgi:S1-C subfamily serine protease